MIRALFLAVVSISISCWLIPTVSSEEAAQMTSCTEASVKPMVEEALDLIKAKEYGKAAVLYKKIAVMCPDAKANLDCGQTLFASAAKYFDVKRTPMFQKDALPILEEAASYLRRAISLFGNDKQATFWKSHAYYLLGDIYHYGLIDLPEAEKMYTASLSLVPTNAVVQKELEDLRENRKR